MALTTTPLTGLCAKIAELATAAFRAERQRAEQIVQLASAKMDADLLPLRAELGVPEAARLQLDGGADGVITASWDPEAIRPKEEATGPVPLKVPRKRK